MWWKYIEESYLNTFEYELKLRRRLHSAHKVSVQSSEASRSHDGWCHQGPTWSVCWLWCAAEKNVDENTMTSGQGRGGDPQLHALKRESQTHLEEGHRSSQTHRMHLTREMISSWFLFETESVCSCFGRIVMYVYCTSFLYRQTSKARVRRLTQTVREVRSSSASM